MLKLKQFLAPPIYVGNNEKTNEARLIYSIVLIFICLDVGMIASAYSLFGADIRTFLSAVFLGILFLILVLIQRGSVSAASTILIVSLWLIIVLAAARSGGGIRSPVTFLFILCTLFAGLFWRVRSALIFAGVCLLAVIVLFIAETNGRIVYNPTAVPPFATVTILTVTLTLTTVVIYFYRLQIDQSLSRLNQEIDDRINAQKALEISEARFRNLFEQAPDAIIISDDAEKILEVNEAACNLYGYDRETLLTMQVIDLIAPEFRSKYEERRRNYSVEFQTSRGLALHQTGQTIPVEAKGGILLSGEDELQLTLIRDLRDRLRLEEEVRHQRDFFVQVMDALGQGVTVTNEDLEFEYVNKTYANMVLSTPEELVGKTPFAFTIREDHHTLTQALQIRKGQKSSSYESKLLRTDGNTLPVWVTGVPRLDKEQLVGTIVSITDMTLLNEMEEKLRQSDAFHRTVLENSFDGVVILDEDGIIQYANPTIREILGYSPEEVAGKDAGEFMVEEEHEEAELYYESLLNKQFLRNQSTRRYYHKDGSIKVIQARQINLLDNPEVKGILSSFHDITPQIEAAVVLEKMNKELEQRVEARTNQLQQTVNLMAGREVRMAELKSIIRMLQEQIKDAGLTPIAKDPLA